MFTHFTCRCLCVLNKKIYYVTGTISTIIEHKNKYYQKYLDNKKVTSQNFVLVNNDNKIITHHNIKDIKRIHNDLIIKSVEKYGCVPFLSLGEIILINTYLNKVDNFKNTEVAEMFYIDKLNKKLEVYKQVLHNAKTTF